MIPKWIWVAHWEWLNYSGKPTKATKAFLTKGAAERYRPRMTRFIGTKYQSLTSKAKITHKEIKLFSYEPETLMAEGD